MNCPHLKHILFDHFFNKDVLHWTVNYMFRPLRRMGLVPDEIYLKNLYRCQMSEKLDLKKPQTFTQKLQWLKLYYHKPEFTTMVDKHAVKKFVAEKIGEQYVVPSLGVWDRPEDIQWDLLPDKFVLKTTYGGGGNVVICKCKDKFDKVKAMNELQKLSKMDISKYLCEWPYMNVPKRIIAEQLLEDSNSRDVDANALLDYKWFCFDGVPKLMYISNDAGATPHTDFFDMDFNHLPLRMKDPNSEVLPEKPAQFEKMKELASILSERIPCVRVDFYVVNNQIFFGEMTFYHASGFAKINPEEWNYQLGKWINLPPKVL